MNLQSKIDLMNALIKENRDITIEEYAETMAEIESVEGHSSKYLQTKSGICIADTLHQTQQKTA